MKTILLRSLTGIFLLFAALGSRAQVDFTDAVSYNDYIVDNQNAIGEAILDFMALIQEGASEESIRESHNTLLQQIDESMKNVESMPAFDGKTRLRDSATGLFGFYRSVVDVGYRELMEMIIKDDQSETAYARMEEIMADITTREAQYDEEFEQAQVEFAKSHNIILEENELEKEFGGSEKD